MKIALEPTSEVGLKAGRLLLGERDLETLGVFRRPVANTDPRIRRIDGLRGFDVFVTDDPELNSVPDALDEEVAVVAWVDGQDFAARGAPVPVMTGANLANGIARSLMERETPGGEAVVVAWTEPGKPLRSGEPITFPDPVGSRWGRVRARRDSATEVVVPVTDEWAGVVVRVERGDATHILGIADLATHLESLALAAGAMTIASGRHEPGAVSPADAADEYVLAALRAGLDIASFTKT